MSRDVDDRILEATHALLAEHGFARLTVEAVAERAGVAKTTIYRRHRNAADLATAAIAHADSDVDAAAAHPDDLPAALRAFLRTFAAKLEGVGLDVLGAMLAEPDGELLALHRERVVLPHRDELAAMVVAAQARGEVRDDVDPLLAIELLVGSFFSRHIAGRALPADAWADGAVELLWRGLRPEA